MTRFSFKPSALSGSTKTETTDSDCKSSSQSKSSSSSETVHLDYLYESLEAFSIEDTTSPLAENTKALEPLLCLSSGAASTPYEDSERGILLTRDVKRDAAILSIPLSSCLCDDSPPDWFYAENPDEMTDSVSDEKNNENKMEFDKNANDNENDNLMEELLADHTNHHLHNPSQWATRLAASLLDLQYSSSKSKKLDKRQKGLAQWLSMGPNPSSLRASLPVHWSDNALSKARCCALELAVDSAYFARAEAVDALLDGLRRRNRKRGDTDNALEEEGIMAAQCHASLDFVQTRVCRVDRLNGLHPPMRILAPIFDFINHGGANGSKSANASFKLEKNPVSMDNDLDENEAADEQENNAYLVVRASRDMKKGDEVLINYGESTRPAWRCLASYGFIPDDKDTDDEEDNGDVAEVFMDGIRYEVGKSTVPMDMVVAAAAAIAAENGEYDIDDENSEHEESENPLTATVALRIAKRVSDVAFDLLLENTKANALPEQLDAYGEDDEDSETAAEIFASSLAASLRYSQHRVLMSCAMGLKDYAGQNMGFE